MPSELPLPSLQNGLLFFVLLIPSCYLLSAFCTWHRLRNIPGPFLGSFSYLWLAWAATSKRQEEIYRDINSSYGPLARVGPNELITDDPDLLRKLGAARGRYGKDKWYISSRFNPYQETLGTVLDNNAHDRIRAQVTAAYNGRDVDPVESCVDTQVDALLRLIRSKYVPTLDNTSPPLLDLGSVTSYLAVDVISRALFGEEFGYLKTNSDSLGYLEQVQNYLPVMAYFMDIAWLRSIAFSKPFLAAFGPKTSDKTGMGRVMGYAPT